jgi:Ras-related protein Rab-39B
LSFASVTHEFYVHAWTCRDDISAEEVNGHATKKRFGCVLVGNKRDAIIGENASKRQVDKNMAEQWASSQGSKHFEITSSERGEVEEVVKALVDSIARARRMDQRDKASEATEKGGSILKLLKRTA